MKRALFLSCATMAMLQLSCGAQAQTRAQYEGLIAAHAKANAVPEALVHRVIVRESKYHPDLIGHGGTIGLMQIKLATARGVGYTGDAFGLRDPDTNLAYGVKYLAGAWRAANGDHDRAVRLYAGGYYYVAKQQRLERTKQAGPELASAPPQEAPKPNESSVIPGRAEGTSPEVRGKGDSPPTSGSGPSDHPGMTASQKPAKPARDAARPKQTLAKPLQLVPKLADGGKPKDAAGKPNAANKAVKKLADAKAAVPRPPAAVTPRANSAAPR